MSRQITIEPLTADTFAPFGDVLECRGEADKIINQGMCGRYHDRAKLDFGPNGRAGISLFNATPRDLPYQLELVERHPEGSQAFVPMHQNPFLVIVAADVNGTPATPRAFVTTGDQAINFHCGTWHGVLTPLQGSGLFAVIDRIGDTENLQEHWFDQPYDVVTAPPIA
jgi:ureidoglycolate lyase